MITTSRKDLLLLFSGRIAQAAVALAAIRILTSLLPKDEVGLTYLVTSMVSYFGLIFVNPLGMYLNRKLHVWHSHHQLKTALKTLNNYLIGVAIVSVPIVLGAYYFFGIGNGFSPWQVVFLIALNVLVGTWFQSLALGLNMLGHQKTFVLANVSTQILGLCFSVGAVFWFKSTAFMWLLGILVGQSLGAIYSWLCYQRLVLSGVQNQVVQIFKTETLHFCLPIAATTAFMWVQSQSYRLIVESNLGAQFLANISVGLGVAVSIAGLIESLVNQYFYPGFYAAISNSTLDGRRKAWQRLFQNAMAFYIPSTLFVVCLGKFILRVLVSSQFAASASLVLWGAIIEFCRMTTNIVYAVSQSEMKTKTTILPYAIGAAFVLVGLGFGVKSASVDQMNLIPIVLTIGGVLVLVTMYWQMSKILHIHLNARFIGIAAVYSAPFALSHFFSDAFNNFLASFALCAVFGLYLLFVISSLYKLAQAQSSEETTV